MPLTSYNIYADNCHQMFNVSNTRYIIIQQIWYYYLQHFTEYIGTKIINKMYEEFT